MLKYFWQFLKSLHYGFCPCIFEKEFHALICAIFQEEEAAEKSI
jgi:hypothetical protein